MLLFSHFNVPIWRTCPTICSERFVCNCCPRKGDFWCASARMRYPLSTAPFPGWYRGTREKRHSKVRELRDITKLVSEIVSKFWELNYGVNFRSWLWRNLNDLIDSAHKDECWSFVQKCIGNRGLCRSSCILGTGIKPFGGKIDAGRVNELKERNILLKSCGRCEFIEENFDICSGFWSGDSRIFPRFLGEKTERWKGKHGINIVVGAKV